MDGIYLSFYFEYLENLILSVFQGFFNFLCGFLNLNSFVHMIYNSCHISNSDRIVSFEILSVLI